MQSKIVVGQFDNRGRGVVAVHHLFAGDVVLQDQPCILWPELSESENVCAACLRYLNKATGPVSACTSCNSARFCSAFCVAAGSQAGTHSPYECSLLQKNVWEGLNAEQADALAFLIHADALRLASGTVEGAQHRWSAITSLVSGHKPDALVAELHSRLVSAAAACGASPADSMDLQTAGKLLGIEAVNSFGVMAAIGAEGERNLRGAGIYARAAMLNHECLPNVARFDAFDGAEPGANTTMTFRLLHDLPGGEELTLSYVPLHLDIEERTEACGEYGFTCQCPRCKSDRRWEASISSGREPVDDPFQGYVDTFLLKFTCGEPECYGTLAPLKGTDCMECNMCGHQRTEQQFLQELDAQ